jgi:hypothetical protein
MHRLCEPACEATVAAEDRREPPRRESDGEGVVGRAGLEPATKGLCVPPRLSPPVSGSWSGLCLAFRPSRRVSTRSPQGASLGVGMADCSAAAFTDFEKFYARAE